jgi:hypothetical protein
MQALGREEFLAPGSIIESHRLIAAIDENANLRNELQTLVNLGKASIEGNLRIGLERLLKKMRDEGYLVLAEQKVVDRLLDMTTLAGAPRMVVRPHQDWHVFRKGRLMYGQIYDWHTVEGASVQLHDGQVYCFYSGGAWERENYGVSYVVADHPLGPYHRPGGGHEALLMRSRPGIVGPGHNSFTTSPDGSQTWIVYHAWDTAQTARRMCIDRLDWDAGRPSTSGPSSGPQAAPAR